MSINRGTDKEDVIYIYDGILAIKKSEVMSLETTWMNLEIILLILSEVSQSKANIIWYHLYMESKKWYKWTYIQNINRLTDKRNKLVTYSTKGDEGR